MPRFAANVSWLFQEVPMLERFAAAARAGFEAVEMNFPYDHSPEDLAAAIRAAGVRNVLLNVAPGDPAKGERGLAAIPARQEEFQEQLGRAVWYAQALETPSIHVMSGVPPPGVERAACYAVYIENLRHAAKALAPHGMIALVEPLNLRDNPGYLVNKLTEVNAILDRVGEPNVKLQLDLYHSQIVEGDLTAKLRRIVQLVGHVQIAGVPDRHEPDSGELNYPYLFSVLDELGYEGWVGCEYRPATTTEAGLGWFAPYRRVR